MHEMPFTQAIMEMALKEAGDKPVKAIYLRVGALSAVVPASVESFFDYLSKETPLEGVRLVFETEPVRLRCRSCGQDTGVPHEEGTDPRRALAAAFAKGCPCQKADFKVLAGLDFDMTGIEV